MKVWCPFPEGEVPEGWPREYVALADHDRLAAELATLRKHMPVDTLELIGENERLRAALEEVRPFTGKATREIVNKALAGAADETKPAKSEPCTCPPRGWASDCREHGYK